MCYVRTLPSQAKVDTIHIGGSKLVVTRKGTTVAFQLVGKLKDGSKVEALRTAEDLESFHRQIVKAECQETKRSKEIVEAVLGFPSLQQGFDIVILVLFLLTFVVGVLKDLGTTSALFSASAVGLISYGVFVWAGLLPGSKDSEKHLNLLEEYLDRTLALRGTETSKLVRALIEPPLRPDWPARVGKIDLGLHDLPHASSQTEWWYFNSHLECKQGRKISLFVCFFRILKHVDKNDKRYYSHALTWALTDVVNGKYYSDVVMESDAPKSMLKALDNGKSLKDPILSRALREILEKGRLPLPDRLFKKNPVIDDSSDELRLEYESGTLVKDDLGVYRISLEHYDFDCKVDLEFNPQKDAVRHGDHGVVKGRQGDDMYYYCIPRCVVSGTVTVPRPTKRGGEQLLSDVLDVSKGSGWYDHEFGGKPEEEWDYGEGVEDNDDAEQHMVRYAWNWVAAQLEDGSEVTAALLMNTVEGTVMEVKAIVVDKDGTRLQYDETEGVVFEAVNGSEWSSVRTFVTYPTKYRLVIPSAGIELDIMAEFPDQEFMTMIAKPAFWEGRCVVTGVKQRKSVTGLAYVERNGFNDETTIKSFFKNVGKKVRSSVQQMYPLHPTHEEGVELIATKETEHYLKGVPLDIIGETLIAPVRLIADRGGKSWRSYGALACVDCVGGDSRDFVDWVAMPEFLHVGSLIIDDIQDESDTRRGGTTAHKKFGTPLCINAGTAAYFQCEQMIKAPGLTAEELNKCYGLYFAALRGGHAGQALDIHGLDYMMDTVVESGDAQLLEERILAIHMLKTAVPAGTLARMGALVGKGSEEQIEAMGLYFESVGVAFQIMDDVLNLRGLYSKESDKLKVGTTLKRLGEDIVDGKVTFPIAKAMAKLETRAERKTLWDIIKSKPQDQEVVDKVIRQLEELGAIDECVVQAEEQVNIAWNKLDAMIPDSFAKMMLRSFGWFVIERIQ
uniref:AttH domain-containing protein n=1 Tax=Mucochytrium quahogii TaxID=96639 RepID=A0A7S2WJU5_9STRA|mmetsp:Transcript_30095/g.47879  ORF Transcript_30095/g.47879 Transcript_30095/m.47879 type:complete len:956 (-) Transcript_30095:64-2931(-)